MLSNITLLCINLDTTLYQARSQGLTRGVQYDEPEAKKFIGGFFNDF